MNKLKQEVHKGPDQMTEKEQAEKRRSDQAVATVKEDAPAIQPQADNSSALISMIERAASDPKVDIEKMERLFEMHERIEGRRAEQLYNASMAAAQAEMPKVVRNQANKSTHSQYADMFAIADKALPVVHQHGFGLSFSEEAATKEAHIGLACTVTHAGGFSKSYHFDIPFDDRGLKGSANKTPTHAYGSTMTYGRRYATCGVFNIVIQGLDRDGNTDELINDEQCAQLIELLSVEGQDMPGFCTAYKIDKLPDLPAAQFAGALKRIENRNAHLAKQGATI